MMVLNFASFNLKLANIEMLEPSKNNPTVIRVRIICDLCTVNGYEKEEWEWDEKWENCRILIYEWNGGEASEDAAEKKKEFRQKLADRKLNQEHPFFYFFIYCLGGKKSHVHIHNY